MKRRTFLAGLAIAAVSPVLAKWPKAKPRHVSSLKIGASYEDLIVRQQRAFAGELGEFGTIRFKFAEFEPSKSDYMQPPESPVSSTG